jgi:hypothetical protein
MATKRKQQAPAKQSAWTRLYMLLHPAEAEHSVYLGGVQVVYNHLTRVVFLVVDDASGVDEKSYSDLASHYEKQGYYLQVISNVTTMVPNTAAAK